MMNLFVSHVRHRVTWLLIAICFPWMNLHAYTFSTCGEKNLAPTFYWEVNPDGESVTLIRTTNPRYGKWPLPTAGATDPATGIKYKVTILGDGVNYLSRYYIDDNINIYPDVEIIRDYALIPGESCYPCLTFKPGSKLKYLGKVCCESITSFIVNNICEIDSTAAHVGYLQINDKMPIALCKNGIFSYADTIRCTSETPHDIDFKLFSTESGYVKCILLVPDGSKELYAAHREWGKFKNLRTESEQKAIEDDFEARNFFHTNGSGQKTFNFRINPDNETVCLVTGFATDTIIGSTKKPKLQTIDLSQPVTDPRSLKKYFITEIGDGKNKVDGIQMLEITPNIRRINNYAKASNVVIPRGCTTLSYIGIGGISSATHLRIPANCHIETLNGFKPDYIYIGTQDTIGNVNSSSVFEINIHGSIRLDQSTPPEVKSSKVISPDSFHDICTLFVPKGSKEAYENHPKWGCFEYIFETDPLAELPDLTPYEPTEETFTAVQHINGSNIEGDATLHLAVNNDKKSVTLLSVEHPFNQLPDIDLAKEVINPLTGKSYPITAINASLYPVKITIPPNIVAINGSVSAYSLELSKENNLMFVKQNGLYCKEKSAKEFTINDGCEFNSVKVIVNDLVIKNVEMIGSGSNIFSFGNTTAPESTSTGRKITCTAKMPPIVNGTLFPSTTYYGMTTLYVPQESIEAYKMAIEWRKFSNIVAIEGTSGEEYIGIDNISEPKITTQPGNLLITMNENGFGQVFDIAGRMIKKIKLSAGQNGIELPPGAYIVCIDGFHPQKVIVR